MMPLTHDKILAPPSQGKRKFRKHFLLGSVGAQAVRYEPSLVSVMVVHDKKTGTVRRALEALPCRHPELGAILVFAIHEVCSRVLRQKTGVESVAQSP